VEEVAVNRAIGVLGIASPLAGIGLVVANGCGNREQPPDLPEHYTTTQQVQDRPLTASVRSTLIKQGPPPLVYMCETPATLRFTDVDTGVDLASASVAARQIVSIDARRGVTVDGNTIVPGPLRGEHRYGIWLDPPAGGSSIRTTTVQPIPHRQSPEMRQSP
jgi:hypothetical protein